MALHGIFADAAGIRLGPVGAEEKAFVHFAIIEVKNSLAIAFVQSIYIITIFIEGYLYPTRAIRSTRPISK